MNSKRRWFQFHLTTAIAVSFVAGFFLWVNLVPSVKVEESVYLQRWGELSDTDEIFHGNLRTKRYGWPYKIAIRTDFQKVEKMIKDSQWISLHSVEEDNLKDWNFKLLTNSGTALIVLITSFYAMERLARRPTSPSRC